MPQKTKKQKMRARQKRTELPPVIFKQLVEPQKKIDLNSPVVRSVTQESVVEPHEIVSATATIADLKKTVFILSLLFALEFLIFYANLKGVI